MTKVTTDNTRLWKQKTGIEIRIVDMGDQHLVNTIKMLIRNADRIAACDRVRDIQAYSAYIKIYGEPDEGGFDDPQLRNGNDVRYLEHLEDDSIYFDMIADAKRRGLTWEYGEEEFKKVNAYNDLWVLKQISETGVANQEKSDFESARESAPEIL